MARGQRKPSKEQIKAMDVKIAQHQAAIKELEEKKTAMIKHLRNEEFSILVEFLEKNNITAEDAMKILKEN